MQQPTAQGNTSMHARPHIAGCTWCRPTPTPRQAAAAAARASGEPGRQQAPSRTPSPSVYAAPTQEAAAAAAAAQARADAIKQEPLLGQPQLQLPGHGAGLGAFPMRPASGLPSHLELQQLQMAPPDIYTRPYAASYQVQQAGAGIPISYGFASAQQPQASAPSSQAYTAPNDLQRKRPRDDFDQVLLSA